jgi:ubiquinone/menaquinone biosynthesis C-methylase UbiE
VLDGTRLPMADASFDSVVSTWTLCSIADVERALDEVRRVLRPDGRFYFLEHGLSPDPKVQKWQRRLEPLNKVLACGCHLTRNFEQIIGGRSLRIVELSTYFQPSEPRFAGYMYRGVAVKA